MANYTIPEFWQKWLPAKAGLKTALVSGWTILDEKIPSFIEAPLNIDVELSTESEIADSSIFLVSAPGAVGKSTLARQIAASTEAVYIDLAKADPVGGNSISGGIFRSNLTLNWSRGNFALLIDGLDEARIRVTQEAFAAFLQDIAEITKDRAVPTVLFGRTAAIQDAWMILGDAGARTSVFEIGFYGPDAAENFAETRLRVLRPKSPYAAVEKDAVRLILNKLRAQTENDGDRFAGYAPVLQAVAGRVNQEANAAALISQIESGEQPITLQDVVVSIMQRERGKLSPLKFEDPKIASVLYLPEEQLDRLAARIYGLQPPDLPSMSANDAQVYTGALESWVNDHPFLDGEKVASSAVFEAVINARALKNEQSRELVMRQELRRGSAANPFLSEFYLGKGAEVGEPISLPLEHIGLIYSSLRARLSLGDNANLLVEGVEDEEEEAESLRAEVEMTVARKASEKPRVLNFVTEQMGVLQLGTHVEDVELLVPYSHVEIGSGPEVVLAAPISIQCAKLSLVSEKVIVEKSPSLLGTGLVYLEAESFDGPNFRAAPILREGVSLAVVWPDSKRHPWTSFATSPTPVENPKLGEALRRFRRFVTAFRSHSKGSLGRYRHKIEHARMTKGSGQEVLNLLVEEKILTLTGAMYYLDPDRLGAVAKANYTDSVKRNFNQETIAFVARSLK